jgi:hypothetical protein
MHISSRKPAWRRWVIVATGLAELLLGIAVWATLWPVAPLAVIVAREALFPPMLSVSAVVLLPDGSPAVGVRVECQYEVNRSGYGDISFTEETAGAATTDAKGRVAFRVPLHDPRASGLNPYGVTAVSLATPDECLGDRGIAPLPALHCQRPLHAVPWALSEDGRRTKSHCFPATDKPSYVRDDLPASATAQFEVVLEPIAAK